MSRMLIICTQDQQIVNHANSGNSGAAAWGPVHFLTAGQAQAAADMQLAGFLAQLDQGEALCLSAHGNDGEIGDSSAADWGWDVAAIANLLAANPPVGWLGPVLISACANTVGNFSARLALALPIPAREGIWCYGYNRGTSTNGTYPSPDVLASQADIQATRVGRGRR